MRPFRFVLAETMFFLTMMTERTSEVLKMIVEQKQVTVTMRLALLQTCFVLSVLIMGMGIASRCALADDGAVKGGDWTAV